MPTNNQQKPQSQGQKPQQGQQVNQQQQRPAGSQPSVNERDERLNRQS